MECRSIEDFLSNLAGIGAERIGFLVKTPANAKTTGYNKSPLLLFVFTKGY